MAEVQDTPRWQEYLQGLPTAVRRHAAFSAIPSTERLITKNGFLFTEIRECEPGIQRYSTSMHRILTGLAVSSLSTRTFPDPEFLNLTLWYY